KQRGPAPPLFVLDRMRLAAYSEESDRFDNRYYARMPRLDMLARDGIRKLIYVVASPSALPEPDDLNSILAAPTDPKVQVQAIALTDFRSDRGSSEPDVLRYGGSAGTEAASWEGGGAGAAAAHVFALRRGAAAPPNLGKIAVIATASGMILAGALDRRGSMN